MRLEGAPSGLQARGLLPGPAPPSRMNESPWLILIGLEPREALELY